ncbi:MAG: AAA family ATPase [Hyphomonadaceae bacterium]|nr:AAA family ATPase [Hyphomonadaceae bacterium]
MAGKGEIVDEAISAIADLDQSCLLIQGPPGAGKTYLASHAIVELIKSGKRVGVASHSHKAINALLAAVDERAGKCGHSFRGVKKSSGEHQFFAGSPNIANTIDNDEATDGGYQLTAGTAWLFARSNMDQRLDYLFIDEAGQVSLANVIAMGVSARNIVLIGDQMQLAQPIQGDHPGGSGRSALEHILGELATVPPERGVFLPLTRRMHPSICQFISDAVYEGRLHADADAARQHLIIDIAADPKGLAPVGLRFVDVIHEGCAQRSPQEAERLKRTFDALCGRRWVDRESVEHEIGVEDILVVTPYNMQANLLQSVLPPKARVGTVDKFQGQQAPVVLISMTTSSGEDLPRQIEFLYSKNRLNVAISRARCLAVVFASPRLLEIGCSSVAQMRLVNTLCWAKLYSEAVQTA